MLVCVTSQYSSLSLPFVCKDFRLIENREVCLFVRSLWRSLFSDFRVIFLSFSFFFSFIMLLATLYTILSFYGYLNPSRRKKNQVKSFFCLSVKRFPSFYPL